jgi:hypothetical protein
MQFTERRPRYRPLSLTASNEKDARCYDSKEGQRLLYQAVEAHKFDLEIKRNVVSGLGHEILDRRVEAAQRLLEWLSQALELEAPVSRAAQKPSP